MAAASRAPRTISHSRAVRIRRLDPGPEHVRPRARPLAGRELEGLVGRGPAVPRPDFRPDASSAAPLPHEGGTEFRFVTDGIHAALEQAKAAAGDKDIRLGGGVSTIQQYLQAQLIDELHLAIAPVLLGRGENLLDGIDLRALGYECVEHIPGVRAAAHVIIRKGLLEPALGP